MFKTQINRSRNKAEAIMNLSCNYCHVIARCILLRLLEPGLKFSPETGLKFSTVSKLSRYKSLPKYNKHATRIIILLKFYLYTYVDTTQEAPKFDLSRLGPCNKENYHRLELVKDKTGDEIIFVCSRENGVYEWKETIRILPKKITNK